MSKKLNRWEATRSCRARTPLAPWPCTLWSYAQDLHKLCEEKRWNPRQGDPRGGELTSGDGGEGVVVPAEDLECGNVEYTTPILGNWYQHRLSMVACMCRAIVLLHQYLCVLIFFLVDFMILDMPVFTIYVCANIRIGARVTDYCYSPWLIFCQEFRKKRCIFF